MTTEITARGYCAFRVRGWMADLLTLADAQARVLASVRPLGAEAVAVADAAGRFLAEDACAAVDLPPFASSAMDGFALRARDAPGRLGRSTTRKARCLRPRSPPRERLSACCRQFATMRRVIAARSKKRWRATSS